MRRALEITLRAVGQLVTACARHSQGFGMVPTGDTGLHIHVITGYFAEWYQHP